MNFQYFKKIYEQLLQIINNYIFNFGFIFHYKIRVTISISNAKGQIYPPDYCGHASTPAQKRLNRTGLSLPYYRLFSSILKFHKDKSLLPAFHYAEFSTPIKGYSQNPPWAAIHCRTSHNYLDSHDFGCGLP